MIAGQRIHPGRQEKVQLLQRELIQQVADQRGDVLLCQRQAVYRHAPHTVGFLDLGRNRGGALALRLRRVQQHDKRLADGLQFPDDALLGWLVVLPRDVCHRTIGGDDHPYGGVIGDDLPRADLRGLGHGDLVVKPGRHHHTGR